MAINTVLGHCQHRLPQSSPAPPCLCISSKARLFCKPISSAGQPQKDRLLILRCHRCRLRCLNRPMYYSPPPTPLHHLLILRHRFSRLPHLCLPPLVFVRPPPSHLPSSPPARPPILSVRPHLLIGSPACSLPPPPSLLPSSNARPLTHLIRPMSCPRCTSCPLLSPVYPSASFVPTLPKSLLLPALLPPPLPQCLSAPLLRLPRPSRALDGRRLTTNHN